MPIATHLVLYKLKSEERLQSPKLREDRLPGGQIACEGKSADEVWTPDLSIDPHP